MAQSERRVALFIKSMSGGGGERFALSLAREWSDAGMPVDLVLAHRRGPLLDQVPDAVRIVDLNAGRSYRSIPSLARLGADARHLLSPALLADLPNMFGAIPPLERYLRREQPRALLASLNFGNLAAIIARRLARVRTRLVVSEHNPLSIRVQQAKRARMRQVPALVGHFYPWADAITACSEGVADDLAATAGLPRESIRSIYNPVVTPGFHERAAEPVAHPWFEPGEPPVVISVGRLRPQKDFPTLLRAFADLRARRAARLMILGTGPEEAKLEAEIRELGIEEDAVLLGFQSNPLAYVSRAEVFASSSAWEGFGIAIVEALACGCPVVSTDSVSGPSEILDKGRYGSLVTVGDARALARAIEATLDAPRDSDRLRARAEDFSSGRAARAYLDILLPRAAR